MNRRRFLLGLLALPVVGPALARAAASLPGLARGQSVLPYHDLSDIITTTIESRSHQIADNVCRDNLLLRHVERDWRAMRPFKVGDEVFIGGKVLVCTRAGTTSRKRVERKTAFLGDYECGRMGGPSVLIGQYLSDDTIWEHDHSRALIRRMRSTQRSRYLPSAWPFDNGLAGA